MTARDTPPTNGTGINAAMLRARIVMRAVPESIPAFRALLDSTSFAASSVAETTWIDGVMHVVPTARMTGLLDAFEMDGIASGRIVR